MRKPDSREKRGRKGMEEATTEEKHKQKLSIAMEAPSM